jgi:predicted nucleic acid-binding protein
MREIIVIADTSCLIALTKTETLGILPQMYRRIIINVLLILDDLKARKEAKRLGVNFTGTLGILFNAKQEGIIPALKPLIDKLQAADFRISPLIINKLLDLSNEL